MKTVAKISIICSFFLLMGCSSQVEDARSYDFITELRKDVPVFIPRNDSNEMKLSENNQ